MSESGGDAMNLYDIIKYEGNNDVFVWKHPCEDFNLGTQLIVHESQEALFYMNGHALDLFGPGKHVLETENIPLLRKVSNLPTYGKTPYHCEIYYINKTDQMAIRWGTDSKVQYIDPTYKFPLSIGANGEMSLAVHDSRNLVVQLVGTELLLTREKMVSYFRSFLMTKVKTYLAQVMREKALNIFEIDEQMELFSEEIHKKLVPDFLDYGIDLKKFLITTIVRPDGEPQYEKFKELHFRQYADIAEAQLQQKVGIIQQQTESQRVVIEAEGIAKKRAVEGYTYQQERGFDVAEKVAENEGCGNFSNVGIGFGLMTGIGNSVGSAVGDIMNSTMPVVTGKMSENNPMRFCDNCGAEIIVGASFCVNCGKALEKSDQCRNCGFVFTKSENFCPKCGTRRILNEK